MTEAIVIAIITAVTTVCAQVMIACRANSLIVYRIEQLETKVEKHNEALAHTHDLELALSNVDQRTKANTHRLDKMDKAG